MSTDYDDQHESEERVLDIQITVRDIPAMMRVIEASAELVRQAESLGFVDGNAPEVDELHKALMCLSPDLEID